MEVQGVTIRVEVEERTCGVTIHESLTKLQLILSLGSLESLDALTPISLGALKPILSYGPVPSKLSVVGTLVSNDTITRFAGIVQINPFLCGMHVLTTICFVL